MATVGNEYVDVLVGSFDALLLDLDGVLYIGEEPVPYAAETLMQCSATFDIRRSYITNNASRTPEKVVDVLRRVGVRASPAEIVTSAQVAAEYLARDLPAGSAVLVVGGEGLDQALDAEGLRAVRSLGDHPVAVVQGFHPDIGWRDLAMAAVAVRSGLPWVASNADLTIPTALGIAPGNGTLIAAVSAATGTDPVVVGKPNTPSVFAAIDRLNSQHPLIVGDRLDTDIEAANRAKVESLLVMTGVTDVRALVEAVAIRRPSYVSLDLRGLLDRYEAPTTTEHGAECGGWSFGVIDHGVVISSRGRDPVRGLRALATVCWAYADENGGDIVECANAIAEIDDRLRSS